jgi:hypothetical protein
MLKLRRVGSINGSTSQIHSEVSGKNTALMFRLFDG